MTKAKKQARKKAASAIRVILKAAKDLVDAEQEILSEHIPNTKRSNVKKRRAVQDEATQDQDSK